MARNLEATANSKADRITPFKVQPKPRCKGSHQPNKSSRLSQVFHTSDSQEISSSEAAQSQPAAKSAVGHPVHSAPDVFLTSTRTMTADDLVTDPQLLSVLAAANASRLACLSILELIESNLDSRDTQSLEDRLVEQRKALNAHLSKVRGLNRNAILNVRTTKAETAQARGEVDTLHLQLQNLKYEQSHLRRQIGICENFDHPYQSLPLIPVEEFLTLHPEHADLEEDSLMLARIKHEHDEREAAKNKQMGLLKRKEELMHENSKRKAELEKLDKQLEEFVSKGAKTILETFETVKMTAEAT